MAPPMRLYSSDWNARLPRCAPLTMSCRARVGALKKSCCRCNCRKRRSERDHLQILSLELQTIAVTISRLARGVAHQLVNQLLRRLNGLEPILERVPEAVDRMLWTRQQFGFLEVFHHGRRQVRSLVMVPRKGVAVTLHGVEGEAAEWNVALAMIGLEQPAFGLDANVRYRRIEYDLILDKVHDLGRAGAGFHDDIDHVASFIIKPVESARSENRIPNMLNRER